MCKLDFKRSEETRIKISNAMKGKKPWNKDKKLSEETKNKMSEAKIGKYLGEKALNWKGGNYDYWARELKKTYKDCSLCHSIYNIKMHHKDSDRENNNRENIIIICNVCHEFWHHN